jgi:hypothetical protein
MNAFIETFVGKFPSEETVQVPGFFRDSDIVSFGFAALQGIKKNLSQNT